MRLLPFQLELFLSLECILLDLSLAQEGHREFTSIEVQSRLDKVDAALVSFEVVKAEKQIDFVILKHGERALDCLATAEELHVSEVHAAQDLRLAHTDGHTCKPCIKLVKHVALLCALLADDCALGAAIDESLYWVSVDLRVDVQHRHIAEELRVVLHGCLIIRTNHLLTNFLLNHFLSVDIVWVRVSHLHLALLLSFLLLHDFFESISDYLLHLLVVARLKSRK